MSFVPMFSHPAREGGCTSMAYWSSAVDAYRIEAGGSLGHWPWFSLMWIQFHNRLARFCVILHLFSARALFV